ncbi:hypothetical protein LCGC14_1429810 [marine sediment metagenome]|uniref:Uncharacterized protein n=1 Tax=marine sediment metagenome TaxID=412755 RepID=A0A0F9KA58_9ZZZZ
MPNEKTIALFIRLALVLLAIARDWAATLGQTNSEIAEAVRAKADKAIKEGEEFLASLPS